MIHQLPFKQFKRRRLTSLLGLAFDGSRLDGVVLRRTNGSVQLQQTFSVTLSLDPLTAEPELVGREILNHLNAAGVRERRCAVCIPLKWALSTHIEMPDLPEADVPGFLQLEAERGFPCDVNTLYYDTSRCSLPSGKQRVTLLGIPRAHIDRLEKVLRAAKLKPLTLSLGITALQPPSAKHSDGVMALAIGESHVALQITTGGGVAALRVFEGAIETAGSEKSLQADLVAREARITLGQLPEDLRNSVRLVRVFGPQELAEQLAAEVEERLEPLGLKVELVSAYSARDFTVHLPSGAPVSRAFSLATRKLSDDVALPEFLPPKVTALQQFAKRYSSGRLRTAGAIAALLLVFVGGAFAFQQWQLSRLQAQWRPMEPRVKQVEALQQKIRQFRAWHDDSLTGMTILKQITIAFPEDGSVSAKTVEIRDLNVVTCTGIAQNNAAWLRTVDRLRAEPTVADLKVIQLRGRTPMQFTFDFRWNEGGAREN